ncbi:MAG: hypothetical protein NTX61_02420 [Bacteroidetes bacterium]|nr:hypothetical protein [Bacteroidota bacterium]
MKIKFIKRITLKRVLIFIGTLVFFAPMVWHYWQKGDKMTWDRWLTGSVFATIIFAAVFYDDLE